MFFSNIILSIILTAVEGLCISFIAGYIVYYLTDIVAQNIKQEKAYKRSLGTLSDMSKIIESLKALGGITENNHLISKESLKPLATTSVPLDDLFLFTQRFDDGIKNEWRKENDYFNFRKDLLFYKNSILSDIKRLDTMFYNLPENLVNTLADIEHAGLYSSVLIAAYFNSISPPSNGELCDSLYKYILLYRELSKYGFHKIEFECSRMPIDELQNMRNGEVKNRAEYEHPKFSNQAARPLAA